MAQRVAEVYVEMRLNREKLAKDLDAARSELVAHVAEMSKIASSVKSVTAFPSPGESYAPQIKGTLEETAKVIAAVNSVDFGKAGKEANDATEGLLERIKKTKERGRELRAATEETLKANESLAKATNAPPAAVKSGVPGPSSSQAEKDAYLKELDKKIRAAQDADPGGSHGGKLDRLSDIVRLSMGLEMQRGGHKSDPAAWSNMAGAELGKKIKDEELDRLYNERIVKAMELMPSETWKAYTAQRTQRRPALDSPHPSPELNAAYLEAAKRAGIEPLAETPKSQEESDKARKLKYAEVQRYREEMAKIQPELSKLAGGGGAGVPPTPPASPPDAPDPDDQRKTAEALDRANKKAAREREESEKQAKKDNAGNSDVSVPGIGTRAAEVVAEFAVINKARAAGEEIAARKEEVAAANFAAQENANRLAEKMAKGPASLPDMGKLEAAEAAEAAKAAAAEEAEVVKRRIATQKEEDRLNQQLHDRKAVAGIPDIGRLEKEEAAVQAAREKDYQAQLAEADKIADLQQRAEAKAGIERLRLNRRLAEDVAKQNAAMASQRGKDDESQYDDRRRQDKADFNAHQAALKDQQAADLREYQATQKLLDQQAAAKGAAAVEVLKMQRQVEEEANKLSAGMVAERAKDDEKQAKDKNKKKLDAERQFFDEVKAAARSAEKLPGAVDDWKKNPTAKNAANVKGLVGDVGGMDVARDIMKASSASMGSKISAQFTAASMAYGNFGGPVVLAMSAARSAVQSVGRAFSYVKDSILDAGNAIARSPLARGFAATLMGLAGTAIVVADSFERMRISFASFTGSAEKGTALFDSLQAFSQRSAFGFRSLGGISQYMLAAGFEGKDLIGIMERIGDVVSMRGIGDPTTAMKNVVEVMQKMRESGIVTWRDVNSLARTGMPAWEAVANRLGVDKKSAELLLKEGRVNVGTVLNSIMDMGDSAKFKGKMQLIEFTPSVLFTHMKDAGEIWAETAGKPIVDAAKETMVAIIEFFRSDAGKQAAKDLAASFTTVIDAFRPIVEAVVPFLPQIAVLAASMGALAIIVPVVTGVVSALGAVFSLILSPVGLVIGAVAWLGNSLYSALNDETYGNEIMNSLSSIWDSIKEIGGLAWDLVKSFFALGEGAGAASIWATVFESLAEWLDLLAFGLQNLDLVWDSVMTDMTLMVMQWADAAWDTTAWLVGKMIGAFTYLGQFIISTWENVKRAATLNFAEMTDAFAEAQNAANEAYTAVQEGMGAGKKSTATAGLEDEKERLDAEIKRKMQERSDAKSDALIDEAMEEQAAENRRIASEKKNARSARPNFDEIIPVKFAFLGFEEMWKKTQESLTGESTVDFEKRTANATEEMNNKMKLLVDSTSGMFEEMKNMNPGLA